MGRILVIRGGALGDFILTLPVLAELRGQFPSARLELLAYPQYGRLAVAAGLADHVEAIEARPLAGFFARGGDLDPRFAANFADCAVVVSFLYDPDGIFRENIARCSRAQFIAGPHRPDERGTTHAVDTFLEPLQRLAIFARDAAPRLPLAGVPNGSGRWLAVHPGSGSESKNWPEPAWAELLGRLALESSWRILLVGGEAEGDRLTRLAARLPADRVSVMRQRPLDEVARRLAACERFVGHDSGITHLAAAVGCPCLVLWGPSNLDLWRPRGAGITVLRAPTGLAELGVDTVRETLTTWIASDDSNRLAR